MTIGVLLFAGACARVRSIVSSRLTLALVAVSALIGCGGTVDAPDAGEHLDSGAITDAGDRPDSGASADAGGPLDSGAIADASPSVCASASDCDDGLYCNGAESCDPSSGAANHFGCVTGTAPCASAAACREADERCATDCELTPDSDGDGRGSIACGGDDCDDEDATRYPGNAEICDATGHDEDCDSTTLGGVTDGDVDGDGFDSVTCCNQQPDASLLCGTDCDDALGGVHPGSTEVCNGIDDDCDGTIDDGVLSTFYRDADGDMFGSDGDTTSACAPPAGYALVGGDCDDGAAGVNPGASESCDMADDDCDGVIDDGVALTCYRDLDGDGFADASMSMTACSCPAGWVEATLPDCHDDDARVHPMQSAWFATSFTDPSGSASYDYDCDVAETPRWTVAKGGPCSSLAASSSLCNGQGWATATPPACGVEADWINCTFIELVPLEPNRCVRATADVRRTQECH